MGIIFYSYKRKDIFLFSPYNLFHSITCLICLLFSFSLLPAPPPAAENMELSSSLISRLQNLDNKPILQTFSPSGSPKNIIQSLRKPNVTSVPNYREMSGMKASTTDTESLGSSNLSEGRELDSLPQPLATVPQLSHADYSQQMEYSKTLYKLTSHQLFHSNTRLSK